MRPTELRKAEQAFPKNEVKLEVLESPLPLPAREEWVCRICGWHAAQTRPEECELCHAGPGAFAREHDLESSADAAVETTPLAEGLWRIRNGFGWGHACYLIEKPAGAVLIDCPDVFTPKLVDFLNSKGGVRQVLYCHHHFLGAGQRARQLFGAETILHEGDRHDRIVTVPIDRWVADEEVAINGGGDEPVRGLLIGGHTPGSTFFHFQGKLFTGDAFSGWNGPLGWFYMDLASVRKARARIADLPIRAIYSSCGHTTKGASRQILGRSGQGGSEPNA
jgi:glyoxylase-like metal-dependent hydrolase (beta-lactamase superfamily II)